MISNYQGKPHWLMCLLKQTPKSLARRQTQSRALRQMAKPPQSHKICPQRNLMKNKICLPWRWNKMAE